MVKRQTGKKFSEGRNEKENERISNKFLEN